MQLSSPYVRVMAKTKRVGDCLEFTGRRFPNGYGRLLDYGREVLAHRVVAEHHFGPSDLLVLHLCDNRACVEPSHLRYGTQAENLRQMSERGRGRKSRLSGAELHAIRTEPGTQREIAAAHGISQPYVSKIRSR